MIIKHLKLADTPSAVSSVIPDCCNIGVIYRVLLATNAAVFCAIWMQSADTPTALFSFFDVTMILETVCILSLMMLCGMRKVALVQQFPVSVQRSLCGITPALIAAALASLIVHLSWLFDGFLQVSVVRVSVLAAFLGMLFQQHFELRARAFSPALGEAKLKALQARIRPHFLFNSINAVLSLIRTEPQRAESALEDLADLFRVLMRDTRDVSTLQDELQLCHQYLSIEKLRLGDRLKVEWEISNLSESDIEQAQIASLLLQPLIENAVHHGVEPSVLPSVINIRLGRQADRIFISVENAFVPDHASKGNQIAMNNIVERLKLLYDVEAEFVAETVGTQFVVRMSYPFQKMLGSSAERDSGVERRGLQRVEKMDLS